MNKYQNYIKYLAKWITEYTKKYHINGVTIGLSGGIDSAVVAAIIDKHTNLKLNCVYIDIENSTLDAKCIKELEKYLSAKVKKVNLVNLYKSMVKTFNVKDQMTKNNIKPRLRMTSLYAIAQDSHSLVLGTSNADELYLGYFTKFGDAGCDLMPLANLNKAQVYAIAKELKIPSIIIKRDPSASLFEDQTDEKEMGVTYKEIDAYLSHKKVSFKAKNTIERLHKVNSHKFSLPLKPSKLLK